MSHAFIETQLAEVALDDRIDFIDLDNVKRRTEYDATELEFMKEFVHDMQYGPRNTPGIHLNVTKKRKIPRIRPAISVLASEHDFSRSAEEGRPDHAAMVELMAENVDENGKILRDIWTGEPLDYEMLNQKASGKGLDMTIAVNDLDPYDILMRACKAHAEANDEV